VINTAYFYIPCLIFDIQINTTIKRLQIKEKIIIFIK